MDKMKKERQKPSKKKLRMKDLELLPDPIWKAEGDNFKVQSFFLKWWQDVARRRFGDENRVIDAAVELGYLRKYTDPATNEESIEPIRFDYDPKLYRESLGIQDDMPIPSGSENHEALQQLYDKLLEGKS